jgi:1-acyl-sn-glycerol-3-phosphate acyltransferase
MQKVLQYIYTTYCAILLVGIYLVLHPFIYVFLQFEKTKPWAYVLTHWWAKIFFVLALMPIDIEYETPIDPKRTYIYVGNHFSYLDVALVQWILSEYSAFIGKASVKKVPLVGYMFRKLHIQVDRSEKDSRAKALQRSIRALKSGRNLLIFPEGGIYAKDFPHMHQPFKDGAFKMAIDQQVPLVPISFLNNYKLMPGVLLKPGRVRIFIHKPIETKGLTNNDLGMINEEIFKVIQTKLLND